MLKLPNIYKNTFLKLGFILFNIGIFLLASAPFLSVIFILLSMIITPFCNEHYKWPKTQGIILIFCGFIFIINSFVLSFSDNTLLDGQDEIKLFFDLFNWLPFFVCFFLIQPYLKSSAQRQIT